jgi:hypothetical protein
MKILLFSFFDTQHGMMIIIRRNLQLEEEEEGILKSHRSISPNVLSNHCLDRTDGKTVCVSNAASVPDL